ncbi:hypothetical protein ACQE3D_24670 (plasmid) [Methylomonas sp. MS20]|uniref:hypothetical protein n=1 Tax=Methylomonas sp. MS20 TaxID=3418769 RepID=UPI003CFD0F2D
MTEYADIRLSQDEYLLLLEFLYLADKSVRSAEHKQVKHTAPYRALIEKLLSYADLLDCGHSVVDLPGFPQRLISDTFESKPIYQTFRESLGEDQFWLQLAHALAVRDVDAELGPPPHDMPDAENEAFEERRLFKQAEKLLEWRDELLRNGVSRLTLRAPDAFDVMTEKTKTHIN